MVAFHTEEWTVPRSVFRLPCEIRKPRREGGFPAPALAEPDECVSRIRFLLTIDSLRDIRIYGSCVLPEEDGSLGNIRIASRSWLSSLLYGWTTWAKFFGLCIESSLFSGYFLWFRSKQSAPAISEIASHAAQGLVYVDLACTVLSSHAALFSFDCGLWFKRPPKILSWIHLKEE